MIDSFKLTNLIIEHFCEEGILTRKEFENLFERADVKQTDIGILTGKEFENLFERAIDRFKKESVK
jgi:hypothetical protein